MYQPVFRKVLERNDDRMMTEKEHIELAKCVLKKTFSFEESANGLPVKTALLIGKDHGLRKSHLKKARKEMGVISENCEGVQYWRMPENEEKP